MKPPHLAAVALALLASAAPARAEDDDAALRQKIQEQIQKIVRLMKENEDALLRVSTGLSGEPTRPKIDLPKPPEGGAPPEGSRGEAPPPEAPKEGPPPEASEAQRAEIARRIKALLEGQKEASREIPAELKELIRMIPRTESNDSSQQPPPPGQPPRPEDQEARDARKQMEEQQKPQDQPQDGKEQRQPRDPNDRTSEDPDESPGGASSTPAVPWLTGLPAEWRDAYANHDYSKIPAAYRDRVHAYLTWLAKQASARDRR